jgi:hypothetical protein
MAPHIARTLERPAAHEIATDNASQHDAIVLLRDVSWQGYQHVLAARGDTQRLASPTTMER